LHVAKLQSDFVAAVSHECEIDKPDSFQCFSAR
jgi:hypothetical protein